MRLVRICRRRNRTRHVVCKKRPLQHRGRVCRCPGDTAVAERRNDFHGPGHLALGHAGRHHSSGQRQRVRSDVGSVLGDAGVRARACPRRRDWQAAAGGTIHSDHSEQLHIWEGRHADQTCACRQLANQHGERLRVSAAAGGRQEGAQGA